MQSWDTASKGGPNNDWSVCTTWIMTRKQQWYLIDVWRQRVDYPTLKANVQALAKQFRARRVLVEDTGAGIGLVQELKSHVPGIIAVKPEGDKASRMAIASAKFEAGQVFLPEQAPWLPDLEAELFAFPGSRYGGGADRQQYKSSRRCELVARGRRSWRRASRLSAEDHARVGGQDQRGVRWRLRLRLPNRTSPVMR